MKMQREYTADGEPTSSTKSPYLACLLQHSDVFTLTFVSCDNTLHSH